MDTKQEALLNFDQANRDIARLFYNTYFREEEDDYGDYRYDIIGDEDKYGFGPIDINEGSYYFSINDAYIALNNKVPYENLVEWYDKSYEAYTKGETFTNLYNYNRYKINPEEYQREKAESIAKSKKRLEDSARDFEKTLGLEEGTIMTKVKELQVGK